jgi:hypothetical protein
MEALFWMWVGAVFLVAVWSVCKVVRYLRKVKNFDQHKNDLKNLIRSHWFILDIQGDKQFFKEYPQVAFAVTPTSIFTAEQVVQWAEDNIPEYDQWVEEWSLLHLPPEEML